MGGRRYLPGPKGLEWQRDRPIESRRAGARSHRRRTRSRRGGGAGCNNMAVAGKGAVSAAVKPIFSRDLGEAKRRVRELYRAWYREVPNTGG